MSEDDSSPDRDVPASRQREAIRERYGDIAETAGEEGGCCSPSTAKSCCGDSKAGPDSGAGSNPGTGTDSETGTDSGTARDSRAETGTDADSDSEAYSRRLGYSDDDLDGVPDTANLGLGCGNPTAIASLGAGDTVLDLGSGAGFDCFLAAREVGETGRVIGVDMTPAMVERARENADESDVSNVEFRLGEIEHLPVADESIDVVISNCVINLSTNKGQVFDEIFRVLGPGGRVAVSDVVRTSDELPADVRRDLDAITGCVGNAAPIPELESLLTDAGFVDVHVAPDEASGSIVDEWDPDRDLGEYFVSARIEATKPEE